MHAGSVDASDGKDATPVTRLGEGRRVVTPKESSVRHASAPCTPLTRLVRVVFVGKEIEMGGLLKVSGRFSPGAHLARPQDGMRSVEGRGGTGVGRAGRH